MINLYFSELHKMGCNNSNSQPEPANDIRKTTISKVATDKETSSLKKIAKNVKNFQELVDELRLMLKEDEFYDYLFRADYLQEMLDYML
jgi:vacuolar-type H+-ATPase subunit E/Vma4